MTAFRDINPQAPVHVLIVPNKIIPTLNDAATEDESLLGHLLTVAAQIARDEGIAEDGYRIITNCGKNAGQEVLHLHLHLLGGKKMGALLQG